MILHQTHTEWKWVLEKCSLFWSGFFLWTLQDGYKSCWKSSNVIHYYFINLATRCCAVVSSVVLCFFRTVHRINWTQSCPRLNTSRVGSVHDLILLGSCEIILASLSSTCGLIFPSHVSFYHFNPFVSNNTWHVSYNGRMAEISNSKSMQSSCCEGHCLVTSRIQSSSPSSPTSYQLFLSLPFRLSHLPQMQITEQCGRLCNPFFFFLKEEMFQGGEDGCTLGRWHTTHRDGSGEEGQEGCGLQFPIS